VLTGAIGRPIGPHEGEDGPIAQLLLAPDTPPVIGEVTATVLVCTLRGDTARQAAASLIPAPRSWSCNRHPPPLHRRGPHPRIAVTLCRAPSRPTIRRTTLARALGPP
jgi:hypothetical protein